MPEKHDLALMKAIRGYEHDLQAIAEIHAHSLLDADTLIGRFQPEGPAPLSAARRRPGGGTRPHVANFVINVDLRCSKRPGQLLGSRASREVA